MATLTHIMCTGIYASIYIHTNVHITYRHIYAHHIHTYKLTQKQKYTHVNTQKNT